MEDRKKNKTNLTPQVSSPFFFKVDCLSVNNVPWQKISKSTQSTNPIDEHVQMSIRKDFRKSSVLDYERTHIFNHFHREWYEIMNHWWQVIFDKYNCRDMQPQKNEMLVIELTSSTKWVTLMSWNVVKIDLKCPEKYIKAYIFFIIQWIEFKFENVKYISIYLTNIKKKQIFLGGNNFLDIR